MATYVRLKAKFGEIVAVEKQYSPGKVMAPIEDEETALGGMRSPGELHKVKNNGYYHSCGFYYLQCAC